MYLIHNPYASLEISASSVEKYTAFIADERNIHYVFVIFYKHCSLSGVERFTCYFGRPVDIGLFLQFHFLDVGEGGKFSL